MAEPCSYMEDVVIWRPTHGTCIELPVVIGDLASVAENGITLAVVGLGETQASCINAVQCGEAYGDPTVAARLSYACLPVTTANLTRIAVEAPQLLAEYFGHGRPVHLRTNSLGCLAVNGADDAPELFESIGSASPYAIACKSFGPNGIRRAMGLTRRLGVQTPWQLRGHMRDPNLRGVAANALRDLRELGRYGLAAINYALSDEISDRTTNSYIRLRTSGHPVHIVIPQDDRVSPPQAVRRSLLEAAERLNVDPNKINSLVDGLIEEVSGPHVPWCTQDGVQTLAALERWRHNLAA